MIDVSNGDGRLLIMLPIDCQIPIVIALADDLQYKLQTTPQKRLGMNQVRRASFCYKT